MSEYTITEKPAVLQPDGTFTITYEAQEPDTFVQRFHVNQEEYRGHLIPRGFPSNYDVNAIMFFQHRFGIRAEDHKITVSKPGEAKLASEKRTFIFHRLYEEKPFFYTLHIPKDTAIDCAVCNPGTLKVEDALTGETVWEARTP